MLAVLGEHVMKACLVDSGLGHPGGEPGHETQGYQKRPHYRQRKVPLRMIWILALTPYPPFAYDSGGYGMKETGEHFGLHYSRVCRIVGGQREAKGRTWPRDHSGSPIRPL